MSRTYVPCDCNIASADHEPHRCEHAADVVIYRRGVERRMLVCRDCVLTGEFVRDLT